MPAALTEVAVVWIADTGNPAGGGSVAFAAPSADAGRSLEAWAVARGVRLALPSDERAPSVAIDWAAGDDVEHAIASAREALVGLDFEATEKALGHAEEVLRAHPELPQAAWLLAEVERTWALRWLRGDGSTAAAGAGTGAAAAPNLEKAKLAWQRAAALDGGRAPALGEKTWDPPAAVTATVRLDGGGDGKGSGNGNARELSLRVDGAATLPGEVARAEGPHALVAVRSDGSIAWAAWAAWTAGATVLATVPGPPACSRDDVSSARLSALSADRVTATGAQCARWVAAIGGDAGVVRVATCERDACGPLVEWRVTSSASWTYAPIAPVETRTHWPAWATWTIAGVGVAGAALAVVVASGALKSAPSETQFVNGGLKVH